MNAEQVRAAIDANCVENKRKLREEYEFVQQRVVPLTIDFFEHKLTVLARQDKTYNTPPYETKDWMIPGIALTDDHLTAVVSHFAKRGIRFESNPLHFYGCTCKKGEHCRVYYHLDVSPKDPKQ